MKTHPALGAMLGALTLPAAAGPAEDAVVAAMRLSEESGYRWVTTVIDDARTYEIAGRTGRDGFSRVTMPAVNALRRRLGRSVTETHVAFIFRGNVDCVVETDTGWRRPDELADAPGDVAAARPPSSAVPGGGLPAPRSRRTQAGTERPAYSNLQPGLSLPHQELGVIVASHDGPLGFEDGTITGTLSETGARLLLVRDGQEAIAPLRATGSFKLWRRGGHIVRYRVTLHGALAIRVSGGTRTVEVNQTSETFVSDVGTTVVEVPPDARARLGGG